MRYEIDFRANLLAAVCVLAVVIVPSTPVRAQVCGDATCSPAENCGNCALDCAAWLGCNVNASDVVTIDFAGDDGAVTHRASGFIGADFTNTNPSDTSFVGVKPRLLSWQLSYNALDRAKRGETYYELKLWDRSLIPSSVGGDWSRWEGYVRQKVRDSKNEPLVHYDIWNEPELSSYWDGALDGRYFEMWRRAYQVIRTENPSALIVGPSTTNLSWMTNTFLPTVQQMGTLPDVLSWHENNDGANVMSRAENVRAALASRGVSIQRISINEYMGRGYETKPGIAVRFFAQLERVGVYSAAKACWEEVSGGVWECAPHFDNLLDANRQKRSIWWAYKSYADLRGRMVPVTGTGRVWGVASQDSGSASGNVLVGSVGSTSPVELRLVNVDRAPFYRSGQPIRIVASRIPNTESASLDAPVAVIDLDYAVSGGTARVLLGGFNLYDAFALSLGASGSSVPTDADGDGFPATEDCDDLDASINPAAAEVIGDGIDNDCDGLIDEGATPTNGSPLIDSFVATPQSGPAPLSVTFTVQASDPDGDALSYDWSFGDGQHMDGVSDVTATHLYPDRGRYKVCVTALDPAGLKSRSCISVVAERTSSSSGGGRGKLGRGR